MILKEFATEVLCLILVVCYAMAARAPRRTPKRNTPKKEMSSYVKAAHALLDFAVKEFIPIPDPDEDLDDERGQGIDLSEDYLDVMFKNIPKHTIDDHRDSKDVGEINKLLPGVVEKTVNKLNSQSRRTWWTWWMPDYWYEGYWDQHNWINQTEVYKQRLVIKLSLAWFLNARRFIYRALEMRKPIMEDKRYKIGFLFHAMRMNVYDQHKLLQGMQQQEADKKLRNFDSNFLLFNKILRMNVDLNDIISYIRLLHYYQPDKPLKTNWIYEQRLKAGLEPPEGSK